MCAVCAALSQSTVPVIRLQSPLSVSRKFGKDKSDSTWLVRLQQGIMQSALLCKTVMSCDTTQHMVGLSLSEPGQ